MTGVQTCALPISAEIQKSAVGRHFRRISTGARRLKVGYVSADFRQHAVAHFIEPVLANHDKNGFEVCCYYNHHNTDVITERLARISERWVHCYGMPDVSLAERIYADGIDILVDLAGHTEGNRLQTFAARPAPIQITYLGYPGTTGLSTIDYRLTDGIADPPGSENFYTEQLLRMPDSLWCYRPSEKMPSVNALPALSNRYITFGSLNNSNKIDSECIRIWSRLLLTVRDSR